MLPVSQEAPEGFQKAGILSPGSAPVWEALQKSPCAPLRHQPPIWKRRRRGEGGRWPTLADAACPQERTWTRGSWLWLQWGDATGFRGLPIFHSGSAWNSCHSCCCNWVPLGKCGVVFGGSPPPRTVVSS